MSIFQEESSFLQFVASELGISSAEVSMQTEFRNLNCWSSLNALFLITRISEEGGIFITSSELSKCTFLKDIHLLIIEKLNGNQ